MSETESHAILREMARHLPPSGSTLHLLEVVADSNRCVGLNAAQNLVQLRPDVNVTTVNVTAHAVSYTDTVGEPSTALQLPDTSNGFDAIMGYGLLTGLPDFNVFLAESLRVLRPGGRLILFEPLSLTTSVTGTVPIRAEGFARRISAGGFARVLGEEVVGIGARTSEGILGRGEKPYRHLTPLERTAISATLGDIPADSSSDNIENATDNALIPIDPTGGLEQVRGQALFLLIQQTPNKPAWALTPDQILTWGAASVLDQLSGKPTALAFTSLPKAVAFMQPAVRDNMIIGVNKVAKYGKTSAARWDFPILLNPTLELVQSAKRYTLPGPLIAVDPAAAISGEE